MMQDRHCKIMVNRMMLPLLATVLIDWFTVFTAAELTAVVKTTSGPVRGEILTNLNSVKYAAFNGIRYAKAPIGYLKFKPPVTDDPWTEVFNATVKDDGCPQISLYTGDFVGSEDCLTLNVITPVTNLTKPPKNLKSVIVWIHGGGFESGDSSTIRFDPIYIVAKDVVYVSFNYRVGAFGFLSLRHRNATGNAGLKDQVFALKWVQANIRQFGGNPNNVTLVGQSSGAHCVGAHVLSEASTGLFHGAISMSGGPLVSNLYMSAAKAQAQAEKLGAALGATSNSKNDLLQILYKASAEEIVNVTSEFSEQHVFPIFFPTIEDISIATDVFMPQCSIVKYITGNFTKVPQILGYTEQEAIWYIEPLETSIEYISEVIDFLEVYRSQWPQKLVEAADIVNLWKGDKLNKTDLQTLINVTSDVLYKVRIDITQRLLAANNDKPIYYYQFSYSSNTSMHKVFRNINVKGCGHVDDLAYLFRSTLYPISTNPADPSRRTVDRVTTMWTNFAKYGNPTPNWINDDFLNVTWPNSGLSGTTLDIGTELAVRPRLISDVAKFLELISWPLLSKMAGCHA